MAEQIALIFVINGSEFAFSFDGHEPLRAAINEALARSGQTGRPEGEWVATISSGTVLDRGTSLERLGLTDGSRVYLALSAGVGG